MNGAASRSETTPGEGRPVRYVCMPGAGFTGSTLLAFLLNAHPDCSSVGAAVGLVPEVDLQSYRCSCSERFLDCDFWKRLDRRMADLGCRLELFKTNRWTTHFTVAANPYLDALLIRSLRNDALNWIRDHLLAVLPSTRCRLERIGLINRTFAEAVLSLTGKSVFVDSSRDHQRPKFLAGVPGLDVRVIHLIRDARANTASIMKNHGIRNPAAATRIWRRANVEAERVRRHLAPDRWLRLRYDELCRDPQAAMDRMADFLGVRRAPVLEDFRSVEHHIIGNEMRVKSSGRVREDTSWRERLSESDLARIARISGPTNRAFGFDWPPGG